MPANHASSRIIEEEEADEWVEERSQEISQSCDDDSLDHIITELHGGSEIECFDKAAEEAEMSSRRVSEGAGLDQPLNKTTLTTFGIRQSRTEYLLLKILKIEGKGLVKQPMQANHEMSRPGDQMKGKVGILEGEKEAIKLTVTEAEEKTKKHSEEQGALKCKLIGAGVRIRQFIFVEDEISKKNHDLKGRVNTLESDKSSLQRLVNHT